jgi:hypothetical protein
MLLIIYRLQQCVLPIWNKGLDRIRANLHGCQMVYFQTKNPEGLGMEKVGGHFYICILRTFCMFYGYCPGGVAQWTSHSPQEQEDPGSNPARVKSF